jgi:hypothetical protein
MRSDSKVDWWKRRRVLWPLGSLLALSLAASLGVAYSNASYVMVYNQTGQLISRLTITAGRDSRIFRDVEDRESVRLVLGGGGGASDIAISTNGVEMWRGEYIEPRGGYRAIVRLRGDGQVECSATISWWQSLLRAVTAPSAPNS